MFIQKRWIIFWIVAVILFTVVAHNAGIARGSEAPIVWTSNGNRALLSINYDGSYILVGMDSVEMTVGCIPGTKCEK